MGGRGGGRFQPKSTDILLLFENICFGNPLEVPL